MTNLDQLDPVYAGGGIRGVTAMLPAIERVFRWF